MLIIRYSNIIIKIRHKPTNTIPTHKRSEFHMESYETLLPISQYPTWISPVGQFGVGTLVGNDRHPHFHRLKILRSAVLHICIRLGQICFCYDIACAIPYWINWKSEEFQMIFLESGRAATCITPCLAKHRIARNTIQYGKICVSENNMA
jgi:hypothetical protein